MTFTYVSEFQQKFKPGDRVWACSLKLNPQKTRFIKYLEPALMECVCNKNPDLEAQNRAKGRFPEYLASIQDGQPINKQATSLSYLHVFHTEQEAWNKFQELLHRTITDSEKAVQEIESMLTRLKSMQKKRGDKTA